MPYKQQTNWFNSMGRTLRPGIEYNRKYKNGANQYSREVLVQISGMVCELNKTGRIDVNVYDSLMNVHHDLVIPV
eukprot:GAHX01002774.1.p1 GENE.GAHX01002774.1~~GAHX01002774.1.p1  ORF type:complete len:75 (-),score=3.77 GAHX01002774.1:161-385(-)